jgi:hypothetical protein
MKKKSKQPAKNSAAARPGAIPSVPIEAVFSFLRGTKGTSSWTKQDFAGTLKISVADAAKILPVIQMQGYIHPYHDEWVTTTAGEDVSGARPPRFSPEKVEEALAELRERIKAVNQNSKSAYKITEAVAFGDFLLQKARVQPVEVGIRLEPRKAKRGESPATQHAAERAFLRELREKAATVNTLPYAEWMSGRTHRRLL